MPVEVKCPGCQALLRIADENLGRKSRCPNCAMVFTAEPSSGVSPFVAPLSDGGPQAAPWESGSASPSNPYAPTYTEPQQSLESGPLAPRRINIDEVISKSWLIFKKHWLMACVVVAIMGGVNFAGNMVQNLLMNVANFAINEPVVTIGIQFLVMAAMYVVQIWLQIGQTMVMLDLARGRPINVSKLFAGGPFLLQAVIAMIVVFVGLVVIAVVLILVPAGIGFAATQTPEGGVIGAVLGGLIAIAPIAVIGLAISQYLPLIVDQNLDAITAFRKSYEITNGNKLTLFLIGIVLTGITIVAGIVGLLMLCVGLIPAMLAVGAFSALVFVVAYLSMTGQVVVVPGAFNDPRSSQSTSMIP